MILEAVAGLRSKPATGTWYRAVPPRHLPTALQYSQTREYPTRFNPGRLARDPFALFYLAESPVVALLEVEAMFGSSLNLNELVPNPASDYAVLNVQVQLRNVLDLTDVESAQIPLAASAQELTGDWRAYHLRKHKDSVPAPVGIAPTQELGAAIHAHQHFAGFLAISAKLPYQKVLGVFPDRIAEGDFVRYLYIDTAGQKQVFSIP